MNASLAHSPQGILRLAVCAVLLQAYAITGIVALVLQSGAKTLTATAVPIAIGSVGMDCVLGAGFFLFLGLREFARLDRKYFVPSVLTILLLVGLAIVTTAQVLAAAALTDIPSAYSSFRSDLAVATIGYLISFLGFIGGAVGLWRVGARYKNNAIKIAAITFVFSFGGASVYLLLFPLFTGVLLLVSALQPKKPSIEEPATQLPPQIDPPSTEP